ncbi:MAG: DUF1186 domain-containing protein, partial [Chlamydiales bacterium]|nr:DUF1186 domain-containing protein [Chlamydiales bacterium]
MSTDIKDPHLIDAQASELLGKLLNGDMEWLSEQDKFVLTENRKAIVQHLNTIFSQEIPRLLGGERCSDATTLFWGLKLAGFFEASETFDWIEKLCHLSIEDLENSLGDYFVTEELSYLLADTMNQWSVLKDVIENPDINEFIRSACLDALVFSVVKKRIDRSEITIYFKSLFHRILIGELDDELLCTHLVSSCSDLWPGECLEEIRESFGLNLVDETHLGLDCVLKDFSQGQEHCIEKLKKQIKQHSFWEELPNIAEPSDKIPSEQWDKLFEQINQFEIETNRVLKEPQRNETCNCGSGKKYKKCCMNKPLLPDLLSNIKIEESIISYGSLEYSDSMKALPEAERESILNLYPLVAENPEEVLQIAPAYIEKYPDIPMLYNFLYGAYRKLKRPREAMKLMKETLQIFPDYLFGRVEYALYLLRRGEPEKAHAALENAGTLSQLYPERTVFHAAE